MQQLYSLGESRISRADYFPFFQVHLLNLCVLNCIETSSELEMQQEASQNCRVPCSLCLGPSFESFSKGCRENNNNNKVLHHQNMHLDSASMIADCILGTASSL